MSVARSRGLEQAIAVCGTLNELARRMKQPRQVVSRWEICPADRLLRMEEVTGVPRHLLRPDLYQGYTLSVMVDTKMGTR